MEFDLTKPCDTCPFLKKGGVRLTQDRVGEIAGMMLETQGSTFACHKTTIEAETEDGDYDMAEGPKSKHCAGALIFAEKHGNATQMMRIMERLGFYKRDALMRDEKVVASVFDSLDEMLEVNAEAMGDGRKARKRARKV